MRHIQYGPIKFADSKLLVIYSYIYVIDGCITVEDCHINLCPSVSNFYQAGDKMARNSAIYVGILVIECCWIVMGESDYMIYKDSKQPLSVWIEDLMSRMSLEEKIGQMTQIEQTLASYEQVLHW